MPYEEWVAVCYGSDLKYIGRVIDEGADTMTIRFLEKRADGCFEIKRGHEEVEKRLVFMRNVAVNWTGPGRYNVPDIKMIAKKNKEHWKLLRLKEKVIIRASILG